MVASWVSQASFEPLGLTIAVAKDRAIESMMQVCALTRALCVLTRAGSQIILESLACWQQTRGFGLEHCRLCVPAPSVSQHTLSGQYFECTVCCGFGACLTC